MLFLKITLLVLVVDVKCSDSDDTKITADDFDASNMAADYFAYKGVKHICSITCTNRKWLRALSLKTFPKLISVSAVTPQAEWKTIECCLRQQYAAVGVLLDVRCDGATSVLERSSEERHFDAMHNWLIIEELKSTNTSSPENDYSFKNTTLTSNVLQRLNLSIDAEITVAFKEGSHGYALFDAFNFGKVQGGQLNMTSLGKWDVEHGRSAQHDQVEGLDTWLADFKYHRRWDFHNLTLRAISVMLVRPEVFTPDLLTGRAYTPGVSAMTKITSMIVDLLREKHNFRFNYSIADRWVGAPARNSTLAVTNAMLWREQDISSTCLRIFPAWLDWMDAFFPHTTFLETKFYYRIPAEGVGKLENKFLQPFTSGVWACVVCACGACGAAVAAAARLEARPKALQFAFFTVLSTFCQQVFEDGLHPVSSTAITGQSRRVAVLTTGISGLLLYNYYTSSVVSWLLSAPPPSIASLEELISSSLEIVFEDIGYTRSWLEVPGYYYGRHHSPKEDVLRQKKVQSKYRKKSVLQTVDDGIELVRAGGYAYHTEPYNANRRILRTFNQEELCDLGSLAMMEKSPVYMVGQRRSPYREFFVWSLMRAQERGHMSCVRRRVRMAEPECAGSSPRALALGGAAPAFLLLAICGWTASIIVLLLETVTHRMRQTSSSTCGQNWDPPPLTYVN